MDSRSRFRSLVETVGIAVIAVSAAAAVALRLLDRATERTGRPKSGGVGSGSDAVDAAIVEEKLRAYRSIMGKIVALNREALELSPDRFQHEADAIAFERESSLYDPYLDVNEVYESHLYVIDEQVRKATSEYVDYLATYHDDGAHAGALLYRAGEVYEAMRADLGLESLFDGESADPPNVGTDTSFEPDPDRPPVEDFTKDLGSVEDLEFFNAGRSTGDAGDGTDGDEEPVDDAGDAGTDSDGGTEAEDGVEESVDDVDDSENPTDDPSRS